MTPTLHRLLERAAMRHPHRTAVYEGGASISYEELVQRVRRFAGSLAALGVEPGDRVAVVLEASVDQVVATYGILAAGAVVVPLSPGARTRGLTHAISLAGATGAVVNPHALRHLPLPAEARTLRFVVCTGDQSRSRDAATAWHPIHFSHLTRQHLAVPPGTDRPDALAALHFTSGTTGLPKGVMLTHRNLVSNVQAVVRYLELTEQDRVALVLPVHYAYGASVVHTHLAAGAAVDVAGSMAFPVRAVEAIEGRRCTGLSSVPSGLARLIDTDLEGRDLSSLRYVTQAGAAMDPGLLHRLRRAVPHARIFVMYGQTEATARLTYLPPEDLNRKPGSVGVPVDGVDIRIRDEQGRDLPPGEVGEVVARGPNVMRGYFRDEEATRRVLRDDGLHTGDLGWKDEDGYLWIQGRRDDVISRGGFRIGPGEIEALFMSQPGVAEAAAVGTRDPELGQAITVLARRRNGAPLDARRLLAACARELPRHELPSRVCLVDRLPHGPTGKLARNRIREHCEGCDSEGGEAPPGCPFRARG